MSNDLLVIGVFAVWHLAMLSSLARYAGSLDKTALVPSAIIKSKSHVLGLLALSLGVLLMVVSAHLGVLYYGIFSVLPAVTLDVFMTYRACIQWRHSGR